MQTRNEFGVTVPNRNSLTAEITVPKKVAKRGRGTRKTRSKKSKYQEKKKLRKFTIMEAA